MVVFVRSHGGATSDVVLVEPAGGRPRDDRFDAYNRGKRSIVADESAEQLPETTPLFFENFIFNVDGVHPLGRTVGGSERTLKDIGVQQLREFLNKYSIGT